jgi:hypothetical protein
MSEQHQGFKTKTPIGLATPISDFLHSRGLFMNKEKIQQEILDFLISTMSSRSFPDCEYRL